MAETNYRPGEPVRAVVVGAVIADQANPTAGGGGQVVMGRRVDPATASLENFPHLQAQYGDKSAMRKVQIIRVGGTLADQYPPFPENRACQDFVWLVAFICLLIGVAGVCFFFVTGDILSELGTSSGISAADEFQYPTVSDVIVCVVAAGVVSLIAAVAYVTACRKYPSCVVWTALIFGPALMIVLGLVCAVLYFSIGVFVLILMAALFILIGVLSLTCVFFCWAQYIPFCIMLVETVATVIEANPCMFVVSLVGSAACIAWVLLVCFAILGVNITYGEDIRGQHQYTQYAIYFVECFVLLWGGLSAYNVCHVTYAGVFGRWYFNKDEGTQLQQSFKVAITTSLGSICFGSALVAFVRALEMTLRKMRRESQNPVACVLLCVLECIVGCIGDMMDYFSEWAYVQCAVRGVSFLDAVRITLSTLLCSHVDFIIRDLLINSVVNLGSLACAALGGGAGAGVGFVLAGPVAAAIGAIVGLYAGILAGGSAVGILSSGVKTVLVLWAQQPEGLAASHPHIHQALEACIEKHMAAYY